MDALTDIFQKLAKLFIAENGHDRDTNRQAGSAAFLEHLETLSQNPYPEAMHVVIRRCYSIELEKACIAEQYAQKTN